MTAFFEIVTTRHAATILPDKAATSQQWSASTSSTSSQANATVRCTLASPTIWFAVSASTRPATHAEGFTKKYNVHRLVYSATFDNPNDAITHEKRLKRWRRVWKLKLIEEHNPQWRDLSEDFTGLSTPPLSFAELSAIQKLSKNLSSRS
jgi:predicted GIY-YIG superfamily endonuclease